jgi:RimJ/RimL family protein N-acetyltransferase
MQSSPVRGLRGELVYLRPLEPADVDVVHRWYEDVRVQALMGDPPISRADRHRRYEEPSRALTPTSSGS